MALLGSAGMVWHIQVRKGRVWQEWRCLARSVPVGRGEVRLGMVRQERTGSVRYVVVVLGAAGLSSVEQG